MEADPDLWELPESGSLGESIEQQLGAGGFFQAFDFYSKGHRMAKSESEDSGVEMASGETSPPTPPSSDHSFYLEEVPTGTACSLDCLAEDWTATSPHLAPREEEEEREWGDGAGPQLLNVKLEQAMQRSKKHRSPAGARCGRRPPLGARRHGGSMPSLNTDIQRARSLQGAATADLEDSWRQRREARRTPAGRRAMLGGLSLQEWQQSRTQAVDVMGNDPLVLPGQGLRYLEHVCQVLEKMAELQRTNQSLRREKRLGGMENEQELLMQGKVCGASHPLGASKSELHHPHLSGSTTAPSGGSRASFRERSMSTSDVANLWDFTAIQGKEVRPPAGITAHFVSTPDLQDTPDGWSRLKPKPQQKSEPSQWERVKDLIGKIARKAVGPMDPHTALSRAPPSRPAHSRDGVMLADRRPAPRKVFLPNIVVKKQKRRVPPVP